MHVEVYDFPFLISLQLYFELPKQTIVKNVIGKNLSIHSGGDFNTDITKKNCSAKLAKLHVFKSF